MSAMVRTFRAVDARTALAAVKSAMGPDAVIVSTQEINGGLFRRSEVEVTAALSPPEPSPPAPTTPPAQQPTPQQHGAARYGTAPSSLAGAVAVAVAAPEPADNRPLQLTQVAAQSQASASTLVSDELIALRSAVEAMRQQLRHQTALNDPSAMMRFPPPIMAMYRHLIERGLEEKAAEDLIRLAAGAHGNQPEALWQAVRGLLAERLIPARPPWQLGSGRVVALVGPTGVGKTTTMAKIAARAVLESKIKVTLITVDTYRIGASDQVARYGTMMNVPVRVAHNANELGRALALSAGSDLVLIDTAGRSVQDDIEAQGAMLRSVSGIESYLCLSAATGARELALTASRYAPLKPQRLIITKLDEAAGPASIASALGSVPRPIACVTTGQRVPDDIHPVTSAQLVELVAGAFTLPT